MSADDDGRNARTRAKLVGVCIAIGAIAGNQGVMIALGVAIGVVMGTALSRRQSGN